MRTSKINYFIVGLFVITMIVALVVAVALLIKQSMTGIKAPEPKKKAAGAKAGAAASRLRAGVQVSAAATKFKEAAARRGARREGVQVLRVEAEIDEGVTSGEHSALAAAAREQEEPIAQ